MFGYREDSKEFCGRISIRVMIFVASFLMIFTQLYITIWFLTFHDWWWFFSLGFAIPANIILPYAVITKKPLLLKFILVYQLLYTLLFVSSVIDLLVRLAHPHSGYLFSYCHPSITRSDCAHRVRVLTGVYMGVYIIFAFVNAFCLTVIWYYYKYSTGENPVSLGRSYGGNSQPAGTRAAPTPVYPRSTSTEPTPTSPNVPKPSETINSGLSTGITLNPPATGVNSTGIASGIGSGGGIFSTTNSYQPYIPPAGTNYNNSDYSSNSANYNPSFYNYSQSGYTSQPVSSAPITPNWGDSGAGFQPAAYNPYSGGQTANISTPGPPPPPRPTFGGPLYDETPGQY